MTIDDSIIRVERGLLGSLLVAPHLFPQVSAVIAVEDLQVDAHRTIFAALSDIWAARKPVNVVSLAEELKRKAEVENIGGYTYLAEIHAAAGAGIDAVTFAKQIKARSVLRAIASVAQEMTQEAQSPTDASETLLERFQGRLMAIRATNREERVMRLGEASLQGIQEIEARMQGTRTGAVPTDFIDLDRIIGGVRESELIILAARPSVGKTALALNIAANIARKGKPVYFASLEMSRIELMDRLFSSASGTGLWGIRSGKMSQDDRDAIMQAHADFESMPMTIDDTAGHTATTITNAARRVKSQEGLGLVVVDYMQLMLSDLPRNVPRHEQVADMSRRLKQLAKELSVPVLCLAQLNRQVENRTGPPKLSDLRESGQIEQDADVVAFLHREEKASDECAIQQIKLIVEKHRSGPTGEIRLAYRRGCVRFENYTIGG